MKAKAVAAVKKVIGIVLAAVLLYGSSVSAAHSWIEKGFLDYAAASKNQTEKTRNSDSWLLVYDSLQSKSHNEMFPAISPSLAENIVTLTPSAKTVPKGSTFMVSVDMEVLTPIAGISFNIGYDRSLLQLEAHFSGLNVVRTGDGVIVTNGIKMVTAGNLLTLSFKVLDDTREASIDLIGIKASDELDKLITFTTAQATINAISNSVGVTVNGTVRTYKTFSSENVTTVRLLQEGESVCETTIPGFQASGQQEQDFTIENVPPGIYTLEVTKVAHTKYLVKNIVVGDAPLDLTADTRPSISIMQMIVGDVNNNGSVNVNDLNLIWSSVNYGKSVAEAQDKSADLNGDGSINVNDLNLAWSSVNYGKGTVEIAY